MIGMYRLTSASGKSYVGSSCNIPRRWSNHRYELSYGKHCNPRLQAAYDKHGPLTEEILLVCREQDLITYEQMCIDAIRPAYNQSKIAGRVDWTPEMRAKSSASNKGQTRKPFTDKARKNMSEAHKGRKRGPCADETRAKISAANKGRIRTAEQIAAQSGRVCTDATRAKMSASRWGKVQTAETRAKKSAAAKRRYAERMQE